LGYQRKSAPCKRTDQSKCPFGGCENQEARTGSQPLNDSAVYEEFRIKLTDDQPPLWLHCCPHWLMKQPAIGEASDIAYWSQNGNLPAFYNASNPMAVKVRNMAKAYDAGYQEGYNERIERERESNK
jgi:hypothetical protein